MRAIGKGLSVPRRLRNPRRSDDPVGCEVEPATVDTVRANGARGITVRCACNQAVMLPFERQWPTEHMPDVALRCRCTACGGRQIESDPNWTGGWRWKAAGLAMRARQDGDADP